MKTSTKTFVIRADKIDIEVRTQMAEIFSEGFTQWLIFFSDDKQKISKTFEHMFILENFYVAFMGNKVIGMAACTNIKSQSVKLNKKELFKNLGIIKGSIAWFTLRKRFNTEIPKNNLKTGSIEYVGIDPKYRGQGVGKRIINYIIENTPYREYIIEEVADTNIPAINLYKKIGFKEYKRKVLPSRTAKRIGINHLISFKKHKK